MRLSRRQVLAGLGSSLVVGVAPAGAAASRAIGGFAFGTSWSAVLPAQADAPAAESAIRNVIASVDGAMSPYLQTSGISRFNAIKTIDWQEMAQNACDVVRESLDVATVCGGVFDPTVGPIVGRYGFGPIRTDAGGCSYHQVVVGADRIRKLVPSLTLDLCGIAKGYAVDRMGATLLDLGVRSYLIDCGGELLARGRHPDGRPWRVAVERPVPGKPLYQRIVQLEGCAVATSGDLSNSYEIGGRRFSHIIDPRRGEPVDHGVASVSVIMESASLADAFATALMVLGPEAGPALAQDRNMAALFILRHGSELREIMTGAFADAVVA